MMRRTKATAAALATLLYTYLALRVLYLAEASPLPGVCYLLSGTFFLAAVMFGAYAHVRFRTVR